MHEILREELSPYVGDFTRAGEKGFRYVKNLPYEDQAQWSVRRLQRNPYLHGLFVELPETLGSFHRQDKLYARNQLVYLSESHKAKLIFRRKGSIPAEASYRKSQSRNNQMMLPHLDSILSDKQRSDAREYRQVAVIWELPSYDEEFNQLEPSSFLLRVCKKDTAIQERQWEGEPILLNALNEMLPKHTTIDNTKLDWDIDVDEEKDI